MNEQAMEIAINASALQVEGGPFGAVVVKDGEIIGVGWNRVTGTNDPTAHGEIVAIRKACEYLGTFILKGCELYTSCEPCPMCMAAIYWARIDKVYYACTDEDAASIGFDDKHIQDELHKYKGARDIPLIHVPEKREDALRAMKKWSNNSERTEY